MGVPGNADLLLLRSAAAEGGYTISRSLRFNASDSVFLSRTPASAGNRKTWTVSCWIKRAALGSTQYIFEGGSPDGATTRFALRFNSTDTINILNNGTLRTTTQVFRDVSAWYHILLAVDTTQSTASNRIRFYVNGSEITTFSSSSDPSLNADTGWNMSAVHSIGTTHIDGGNYLNAYLADFYSIDGQALTPSSFTEVSATTGQLVPKQYSGSFGTNGFWLKFSDNSAATATTLGKDYSGNSNNWTPNNLSVTAGAGNDSLVDTPTSYGTSTGIGGEQRGNYAVLNPLDKNPDAALANGNLDYTPGGSVWRPVRATIGVTSGKWYWEVSISNIGILGIATQSTPLGNDYYPGIDATSYGYTYVGTKYNNGSSTSYGSSYTTGDLIGVAYDADNGKVWFSKNGTWQASGDPAAGTNAAYTGINTALTYFPMIAFSGTGTSVFNAGQRAFAYTAPSGFKALVDTNLTAPVIAKSASAFDVKLYTGNDSTQSISLGFSPDFLWFKSRSTASQHALYDIIRGASKSLVSNSTASEATEGGGLATFDSAGFSLSGDNTIQGSTNGSGRSYVVWAWDAGTTTSSNGSGSITSQVRANASAGFSIVSYTAAYTGSARTVGHGLGVKPNLIILKNRNDGSANWRVYHSASGASLPLVLNSTAAASANIGIWNNTEPTSSVFTIGVNTDVGGNIGSGEGLIAYCFAPVAGYSSFGSYVGNGSASDGPFIYTGFKPRFFVFKRTDTTGQWIVVDTARSPYNPAILNLNLNLSDTEYSGYATEDFVSNGLKLRTSDANWNASGGTYVYFAFASNPFQYSRAG